MSATPIHDALPGEDLIGIEPPLLQEVDAGWLHRLNPFTGRALTAAVLQSEQLYRAGRLAVLGQAVTQGVVKGLAVSTRFHRRRSTAAGLARIRDLRFRRRCRA